MKTFITILTLVITTAAAPLAQASECYRPVVVRTCEVCRNNECRWATDSCGRRISYMVTVITYRSHYSNGATSTFTRTYRA